MILPTLLKKKNFLVERFRREWEVMERSARREHIIATVKETGSMFGKGLLAALLLGGAVSLALIAPNIFAAIPRGQKGRFYFSGSYLKKKLPYLKRHSYITVTNSNGQRIMRLTAKGVAREIKERFNTLSIHQQPIWDQIWRVAMFDIPNDEKLARESLRHHLKSMGFYRMQESVFVYPYPCKPEIDFAASLYTIEPYIRYIETSHIENDSDIRTHFGL